jgi:hypothetical protein
MSRPQKIKAEGIDRRAIDEPGETLAHIGRQSFIDELRADPFGGEPLAGVFGALLLGRATDNQKTFAGNLIADVIATTNAEQLAAFFDRVAKMKRTAEQAHRTARAYLSYCRFIEATDREPSKAELKNFLSARPSEYPGMPPEDDKKAWTRLWQDAGLQTLPPR